MALVMSAQSWNRSTAHGQKIGAGVRVATERKQNALEAELIEADRVRKERHSIPQSQILRTAEGYGKAQQDKTSTRDYGEERAEDTRGMDLNYLMAYDSRDRGARAAKRATVARASEAATETRGKKEKVVVNQDGFFGEDIGEDEDDDKDMHGT
ncbi:hypothetical protein PHLCEN_2v10042 [Hermanssonia centrifuga]|uniref:Uncharacterized protein n=1 Tax=Hermanssonia centrifuga TaxID=98765 RepID=A0A2R6NPY9_9APHY|nr:hypothetical protein PHLCEN_2v10042 [Hermanssonia centrifuga]